MLNNSNKKTFYEQLILTENSEWYFLAAQTFDCAYITPIEMTLELSIPKSYAHDEYPLAVKIYIYILQNTPLFWEREGGRGKNG